VLLCGARPVFADIEPGGFHLDPAAFENAIGPATRAVIPVHLFGRCADIESICATALRREVVVVEDAAQAIGAARNGAAAGAWAAAGCFSFYPSKNLGAAGDAGGITTRDPDVAERVGLLGSHGIDRHGAHALAGTTSRLDALQAAVLRAKLPYLKKWTDGRVRNARLYAEELADCPGLTLPAVGAGEDVVWNQYTLRCSDAGKVRQALAAAGIEWRHYYPRPACREPGLGTQRSREGEFPETERACAEVVSVPVRGSCSAEQIREVAAVIRRAAAD
jgi:dTDP-4-amino-4,6-dideoxygalactose transaminase